MGDTEEQVHLMYADVVGPRRQCVWIPSFND